MDINKYIHLVEQIIQSKKLTQEEKKKYLMLIEKLQKMTNLTPQLYEKKAYQFKDKYLTEKERIIYELNRLTKYKSIQLNPSSIKRLAYQLSRSNTKDNYTDLKKKITKLQLDNNISPSFYSVFEKLVEEETKPSMQETINEEEKVVKKNK